MPLVIDCNEPSLRRTLRKLALGTLYRLEEWRDRLIGNHDPNLPPRRLYFIGGDRSSYHRLGKKWFKHLVKQGGVKPHHRVLDIGCGVGRMAVPFLDYLNERGSYEGVDIVREGIDWCNENLARRRPGFRFSHLDVHNELYNPKGMLSGGSVKLPFADASFDFVFLTSVFTHLLPADAENYTREVARLLRPGGKVLATYFLLDEISLEKMGSRLGSRVFFDTGKGFWKQADTVAEGAIGYPEDTVRKLYQSLGLEVLEPVHHGSWSGREGVRNQDFLVAKRLK